MNFVACVIDPVDPRKNAVMTGEIRTSDDFVAAEVKINDKEGKVQGTGVLMSNTIKCERPCCDVDSNAISIQKQPEAPTLSKRISSRTALRALTILSTQIL